MHDNCTKLIVNSCTTTLILC